MEIDVTTAFNELNLGEHNPTHNVSAGKDLNYYC